MRAIYGKPDNPDSSHILIIRGVDVYSIDYFTEHVKKYPTWGLILAWDADEVSYFAEAMVKTLPQTSIHQFVSDIFSCDEDIPEDVLRNLKREMIGKLLEPEYSHLFNFEIEKDSPDVITISSSMVVGRKEIPTIESGPFYGPTY